MCRFCLYALQFSAVSAVGLAEGSSHINWKLLGKTWLWWIAGYGLVLLFTSLLVAQGKPVLQCNDNNACSMVACFQIVVQQATQPILPV